MTRISFNKIVSNKLEQKHRAPVTYYHVSNDHTMLKKFIKLSLSSKQNMQKTQKARKDKKN